MTARWPERDAGAVAKVAAAHKLERKLEARRQRQHGRKQGSSKALLRLAEIQRLIQHRHGGPCDTDDGLTYLQAAIPSLLNQAGGPTAEALAGMVLEWRARWVPGVLNLDALAIAAEIERDALAGRRIHLKADAAARLLNVRMAERTAIGLRSIGAVDRSSARRAELRKAAKAERERKRREKAGATPRVRSKAALKPWEAAGLSRASWYRQKARETNSCPVGSRSDPVTDTDVSQVAGHAPAAGPAMGLDSASQTRSAGGHSPRGKAKELQASQTGTLPLPSDEVRSNGGYRSKANPPSKVALHVREAKRSSKRTPEGTFPVQKLPRAPAPQSRNKSQTR